MSAIEDFAKTFVAQTGVQGIDWSKYDILDYTYIQEVLAPAVLDMMKVIVTLDTGNSWTMTAKQAETSFGVTSDQISSSAADVWDAIKHGELKLAYNKAVGFPAEQLKQTIGGVSLYASSCAELHYKGVVRDVVAAGKITRAEAQDHADSCVKIARSIVYLDQKGMLSAIKAKPAQSGLGMPVLVACAANPLACGIIAVAAVLLILGLALFIYLSINAARVQNKMIDECAKLSVKGDNAGYVACMQAANDMPNAALAPLYKGISDTAKTLAYFAGAGLLAYIGVKWVWPEIQKQRKAASA